MFSMREKLAGPRGFSLIEILLVIGVIAVLSLAAFLVFRKVSISANSKTDIQNIHAIVAGMNQTYKSGGPYTGINNAIARQARILPQSMADGHSATSSGFTIWSGNPRNYILQFDDMDAEACLKIVPAVELHFPYIAIDNGESNNFAKLPPSILLTTATLINRCTGGDDKVRVLFYSG